MSPTTVELEISAALPLEGRHHLAAWHRLWDRLADWIRALDGWDGSTA